MSASAISVSGSVKKQVTCETCGHRYEYEMSRTATGTYSGFATTRQEADERAAVDAAHQLHSVLSAECDVVPCPQCGAITKEMAAAKTDWLSLSVAGIVLGAAMITGVYWVGQWSGRWFYVIGLLGICFVLCGIGQFFTGLYGWIFGDRASKKNRRDAT